MFPLGLRAFIENHMVYSCDFSVVTDRATRSGTVSVNVDGQEYESDIYMMITNASAMNGDVYEYDVLCDESGRCYLVFFDFENGCYVGLNGELRLTLHSEMFNFEIIGNIVENKELLDYLDVSPIADIIDQLMSMISDKDDSKSIISDMVVMADISEVDFDDSIQTELQECTKNDISITDVIDSSTTITAYSEGDITDEYVEWVYSKYNEEQISSSVQCEVYDDCIYIYASGAFNEKESKGAYAFFIEWAGRTISKSGTLSNSSTKNSTELESILNALKLITVPSEVKIYSASKYALFPFIKGWVYDWKKNNWVKEGKKKKISDYKLFSDVLRLTDVHNSEFILCEESQPNPIISVCFEEAEACLA